MELSHLELRAEVDALVGELRAWAGAAPDWPPARQARALVERLAERANTLSVRLDAPLVVATLGGTGTGKSFLVNALVGDEVAQPGRLRPTTRRPTLICRSNLTPQLLGIDPATVDLVHCDLPTLNDLVLLDCPDPDTTEDTTAAGTNLARLRELLPHCDVLLVTTTQQRYRDARVLDELASAASGARLVFVQTHADLDDDIRDDWRGLLASGYQPGEIFLVDSLSALSALRSGQPVPPEFTRLLDLLTRELAGTAARRIRRANFLDLVDETLSACRARLAAGMPAIEQLEAGLMEQRSRLAGKLADQMREQLLGSRRIWENRLLGEIASRWGFSPFACVLRLYEGLGGLLATAALWRVRSPAQLAIWGALEAGRRWNVQRQEQQAEGATTRAVGLGWDEGELRTTAIIVEGYAGDAGLPRTETQLAMVERQAADAATRFVAETANELQALVARLAQRHTGWFTRWRYELLLLAMMGLLLYRFGRNFFYDSWLAVELGFQPQAVPVLGVDFFLGAGLVLVMWCALLLWSFTSRLRRGLTAEIDQLSQGWKQARLAGGMFPVLEAHCRAIHLARQDLEGLASRVGELRLRVAETEPAIGHRQRASPSL